MTTRTTSTDTPAPDSIPSTTDARTRFLLACGLAAGPLYLIVGFTQAFTRPGYDPAHNDLSVLANGDLGWIQISNLILTGLLTFLGALGIRNVLRGGKGGTWGPALLGIYGLGLIGAGIFVADPMNGFPPGTAPGHTAPGSIHGLLHFVTGGIGFVAFIAGCFVLSRRFFAAGARGFGTFSITTGVLFLAAFAGIATGSADAVIILSFTAAVILAWVWLALVAIRLRRQPAHP